MKANLRKMQPPGFIRPLELLGCGIRVYCTPPWSSPSLHSLRKTGPDSTGKRLF